jgi:hypothetical protein
MSTRPRTPWVPLGRVAVRLEWKLADLWVGAFWSFDKATGGDVWICLLPCLPIHIITGLHAKVARKVWEKRRRP